MVSSSRSAATPVGIPTVRTAIACAVTAVVAIGCQQDCITGESAVVLEVPSASWVVDRFCVDDECLAASERQSPPDGAEAGTPISVGYGIRVGGRPDAYRYEVELTAPDGTRHAHDGVVETIGNLMGGETCRPTSSSATLQIDGDGKLTTDGP